MFLNFLCQLITRSDIAVTAVFFANTASRKCILCERSQRGRVASHCGE